jgi:transcriptional regulator with XRE-family HTH domain
MLSVEQIKEMLKDRNLEIVAERTGLSRQTLSNIRNGKAKAPSYSTIKTISDYLEGKNNG